MFRAVRGPCSNESLGQLNNAGRFEVEMQPVSRRQLDENGTILTYTGLAEVSSRCNSLGLAH